MKLTFKTIGNKLYQYECLPTTTLEQIIQGLSGLVQKPPQNLSLFQKKKLTDTSITVEQAGFTEEQYIVLFISNKPVAQPKPSLPKTPIVEQPSKEPSAPMKEKISDQGIPLPQFSCSKLDQEKQTQKDELKETPKDELKETPKDELKETPKGEIKETPKEKSEDKAGPSVEPLPDIVERKPDPPGFSAKVAKLMELGYNQFDCECALRSALGNMDRAVDYLLSGYYPDLPTFYEPNQIQQQEQNEDEEEAEEISPNQVFNEEEEEEDDQLQEFLRFRNQLIQNPQLLRQFLDQMANDNPEMAPLIRQDPAMFLVNVGLNPNDFDLSDLTPKTQYEELMSRFTTEEQTIIHKLEKKGFDTMVVIQVFDACDKNEQTTIECLMSMQ